MIQKFDLDRTNPLLSIFPAEIWAMVLNRIVNGQELWNVLSADPLFLLLLQANQRVWPSTLIAMAFPHLYKYMNTNGILNCRRVCKRLKNSVDTFLESGQHLNGTLPDTLAIMKLDNYGYRPPRLKNLAQITQEMKMFPKAKIVGGNLQCIYWRETPVEVCRPFFQEQVHKVLHLFLGFIRSDEKISPLELISGIRETVETTANLISLRIFLSEVETEELGVPHRLWEDRVCHLLQENPLPTLPNLTRLEIYERKKVLFHSKATFVIQRILDLYKGQLQQLYMRGVDASLPEDMGMLTHLRIYTRDETVLQHLKNIRAPLQQICLELVKDDFPFRFEEIFQILQNFRSTLRDLTLEGSCANDGFQANTEQNHLQFPVLENLKMEDTCVDHCANYDFLLGMPSLRQLKLNIRISKNVEERELLAAGSLRLTDYLEEDGQYRQVLNLQRFKECAIWEHLPRLGSVQIWKKTNCGERFPWSGY